MKRSLTDQLTAWKNSPKRKPLLLQGARQVGKTYLLKEFGKAAYEDVAYFNFESHPKLDALFQDDLDPANILKKLSVFLERKIDPRRTLLIFDEIQESDRALNSLKYFSETSESGESGEDLHLAAAGSLLGIKLSKTGGFPVGKVHFLHLHPMSYFEFLEAVGKPMLRDFLSEALSPTPLPEPFHAESLEWLKKYFIIGGMPEAVATYASQQDWGPVRKVQEEILKAYQLDFSKHVSTGDILKIASIWSHVPGQLAKENKKFIFSALRKSARAREYENALQWLVDAGLIHKSCLISVPKHPLEAYAEKDFFKAYLVDTGLLGAMSGLSPKIILDGDRLFQEFSGAMTENYVAQELVAAGQKGLYYWTSSGTAEVDFVVTCGEKILPLEVKAGLSKGKKSLQAYQKKYQARVIARASPNNLKRDGDFLNIPLYLINGLEKFSDVSE